MHRCAIYRPPREFRTSQMQGSFQDFNVDWGNTLLNPGMDEETSKLYHQATAVLNHPKSGEEPPRRRKGPVRRKRKGMRFVLGARGRPAAADDDEEDQEEEEEEEEDEEDSESGGSPEPPADSAAEGGGSESAGDDDVGNKFTPPIPPALTFTVGEGYLCFYVIPGRWEARPGTMGHYLKPVQINDLFEAIPYPTPDEYDRSTRTTIDATRMLAGVPGFPWPNAEVCYKVYKAAEVSRHTAIIPTEAMLSELNWVYSALFKKELSGVAALFKNTDLDKAFAIPRGAFLSTHEGHETYLHIGPPGDRDPSFIPAIDLMQEGVDYVRASPPWSPPDYYEIGVNLLKEAVERAELLDLAFARRIMGLLGVAQDAVWACLDPDFNPADRQEILDRFISNYTQDFYKSVTWVDTPDARAVGTEAIQQHKAFCQVFLGSLTMCSMSCSATMPSQPSISQSLSAG